MIRSRYQHGAAVVNNKVYVVGGRGHGEDRWVSTNTADVFDPVANSWNEIANMSCSRRGPACTAMDGKLYVCGGSKDGRHALSSCESYDPVTKSWESMPNMKTARSYAAAVCFGGKIYISGGWNPDQKYLNCVEVCFNLSLQ